MLQDLCLRRKAPEMCSCPAARRYQVGAGTGVVSLPRQASPTTAPNTNPATCATQATPAFGETKNWDTNQNSNRSHAGSRGHRIMGGTKMRVRTGDRGKLTR